MEVDDNGFISAILYYGSRDKSIIVWDLTSKSEKRRTSLSDGEYVLFGIATDVSVTNGKIKPRLFGRNHFISAIDVSSDGEYVLSADWDGFCAYGM